MTPIYELETLTSEDWERYNRLKSNPKYRKIVKDVTLKQRQANREKQRRFNERHKERKPELNRKYYQARKQRRLLEMQEAVNDSFSTRVAN